MDNRLKDRIAIITGGSSGLGAATARRFADSGARVVVSDLNSAGVEKEINDKHGKDRAIFVKVDVTKESEIENMVNEAAQWGGRVDIICNYAGVAAETKQGMKMRAHEVDVADFDFVRSTSSANLPSSI